MDRSAEFVVIGAGLAGLAAAAYLGRGGRSVTVVEKASAPGGRAVTRQKSGFSMNLGPHALYLGGAGKPVLDELGVRIQGAPPSASGGYAFDGGRLHTLPTGFGSLLTTGLLPLPAKIEFARLMTKLGTLDPAPLDRTPVSTWIAQAARAPEVRRTLAGLIRVSTYTADLDTLSAGAAIRQLQIAARDNVLYLDGGWQVLVEGLRQAAVAAGASILTGARAIGVDVTGGAVSGVRLAGGERVAARAVVIAASPAAASALVPGDPHLARCAAEAVPVEAACLDVALSALPQPSRRFALGLDRPLYFSVHSAVAALAPEGGAMIHVAEYLVPGRRADDTELAALLERMQPGSRELIVERSFLPSITVSNAIVTAEGGGLAGRPGAVVPTVSGLFLAGDWVGPEGLLADASLASAKRAAAEACGGERGAKREAA